MEGNIRDPSRKGGKHRDSSNAARTFRPKIPVVKNNPSQTQRKDDQIQEEPTSDELRRREARRAKRNKNKERLPAAEETAQQARRRDRTETQGWTSIRGKSVTNNKKAIQVTEVDSFVMDAHFHNFYAEKKDSSKVHCLYDLHACREKFDLTTYSAQDLQKAFQSRSITKVFSYLNGLQIKILMFKPPFENIKFLKKPYLWQNLRKHTFIC